MSNSRFQGGNRVSKLCSPLVDGASCCIFCFKLKSNLKKKKRERNRGLFKVGPRGPQMNRIWAFSSSPDPGRFPFVRPDFRLLLLQLRRSPKSLQGKAAIFPRPCSSSIDRSSRPASHRRSSAEEVEGGKEATMRFGFAIGVFGVLILSHAAYSTVQCKRARSNLCEFSRFLLSRACSRGCSGGA